VALVLAAAVGPGFWIVALVIGFIAWPRFARQVRAEVLSIRHRDFVALATVAGASSRYILWRHILPNVLNSVVIVGTVLVGWAIIVEAALSFLGVGIPPPTPTWGNMVADGRTYMGVYGGSRCFLASRSRWSVSRSTCWGTGCGICSTRSCGISKDSITTNSGPLVRAKVFGQVRQSHERRGTVGKN